MFSKPYFVVQGPSGPRCAHFHRAIDAGLGRCWKAAGKRAYAVFIDASGNERPVTPAERAAIAAAVPRPKGRPRKAAADAQTERAVAYLTPGEMEQYAIRAGYRRRTLQDHIRDLLAADLAGGGPLRSD